MARPIARAILADWLAAYAPPPGLVVELGSYQVTPDADLRELFPGRRVVGVDAAVGPGVDVQADGCDVPLRAESAAIVVSLDTLEHVREPWRFVQDAYRLLAPGGYLFLITVFWFPVHHRPDYWRFTPDGLEALLAMAGASSYQSWYHGGAAGEDQTPPTVGAVARKAMALRAVHPSLRVPAEVPT